jgi:anti-sigma factor RsiW
MSDYEPQPELDDELLSAYLDDELSPAERAAVEARLSDDPSAQQLLHQLRSVSEAVQALPQEVVGHDMRQSILSKAELARESAAIPGLLAVGEHADASNGEAAATLDAAPKFTFGQTRRGWVWASLAIAAALLIMVFGREPQRDRLPAVAKREGRTTDASGRGRDLEIRAANEPAAAPAASEGTRPVPTNFSWQMRTDMDARPTPSSGPEPQSGTLRLETAAETSSAPAAVPAPPAEEARRNLGGYLTDAAQPANKDESLAEGVAEMPASDYLAAADTPAMEVHDLSAANELGDASVAGEPAPPADEAPPVEDPVVVVRVHAKRAALETKAFDRLLERSGIEVDSAVDDAGATNLAQETRAARPFAENGQAAAAAETAPDKRKEDATVEAVLVEASPAAIASCMDGLNRDVENFVGLVVDDTSAVKAQSAVDEARDSQVFAKQQMAETLELSKYNRGTVPAEPESLDRDKSHFYDSYGAGFGGGRFGGGQSGGVAGGELGLEQVRQERMFRARKTLTESNAGLAVRLKWGTDAQPQDGSLRLQSAPAGQTDGKAARGAAAFKAQDLGREMKEAEQAATDNKLQVLFLFSCEDPAAATPTAPSRGKAQ